MWISFDKDEDVEWLVKEFAKKKPRKIVESFLRAEKINLVTFFQIYRQK